MKSERLGILALATVAGLVWAGVGTAHAQGPSIEEPATAIAAAQEGQYERATAAIDRGQYRQAVDLFRELVSQGSSRADAALYWIAYAQNRQGNRGAALRTIAELRSDYPASAWIDDAGYLEAEVRAETGQQLEPEEHDAEEMRMHALNALMHVDSARALPLLERILAGDASEEMKERALFILLQSDDPDAFDAAAAVARDSEYPDLQAAALQHLGMAGGDRALAILAEVYETSESLEVREAILHGFMMAGDQTRLMEIARNESSDELRVAAIHALAMNGGSALWELYATETSVEAREAILHSMVMTGEVDRLIEMARTEPEPRLRRAALESLSIMGDGDDPEKREAVRALMLEVYREETDPALREAAIHTLWMQGDAVGLIELFEAEDDTDMQRRIVEMLSMMESEEAIEFLVRLIEG